MAGGMTSLVTGLALAATGRLMLLVLPPVFSNYGIVLVLVIALVAIMREAGWISFRMPEMRRQTSGAWGKSYPSLVAATLWGFDIGLIFSTRFTFSAMWLLVSMAIIVGDPVFGMVLVGSYWLGRALSIWVAPWLMPNANFTPKLLKLIDQQHGLFWQIHVAILVWSAIVLTIWIAGIGGM